MDQENHLALQNVVESDLIIFFEQQLDSDASYMAAFDNSPANQKDFIAQWKRMLVDPAVLIRTIIFDEQVVGYVMSYESKPCMPEVSYWIGKEYWGKGFATAALSKFLASVNKTRPIYARVAKDNKGSRRVLEKCEFVILSENRGFASARGKEISELVLKKV